MKPDKMERAAVGIVVCAVRDGAGGVRLVLDDVRAPTAVYPESWRSHRFFTETTVDGTAFDACRFTEEQLAEVGRAVLARLAALSTREGP